MKRTKRILAIGAFSLLVLGIPAVASAQYGNRDRNNDRNGGYNNGGYYGNGGDMRSTVKRLKNNTRQFQRQLDRDLDRSRYNGTNREDQINEIADRFKDAVNRLNERDFDNNRRGNNNDNDFRQVMNLAGQLERSMGRSNVNSGTRNLWVAIRNDLNDLGRGSYGNGQWGNGRGNRRGNNNGNNGNWGNGGGMPSWWPF